jgi:hypothetical protein
MRRLDVDSLHTAIAVGDAAAIYGAISNEDDVKSSSSDESNKEESTLDLFLENLSSKKPSPETIDFSVSLLPFTATILLASAVNPKNFKETVMPASLCVSTGLGVLLKFNQLMEKKGYSFLSRISPDASEHFTRAAYVILMGGLYLLQMGAMDDFANSFKEKLSPWNIVINTIGLLAVSGFTGFSGKKFPGVHYTAEQQFKNECGLNISSFGFLLKNIIAGIVAKTAADEAAWTPAFKLMFASLLFITATAYEMRKAWVISHLVSGEQTPSPLVAQSFVSTAHRQVVVPAALNTNLVFHIA